MQALGRVGSVVVVQVPERLGSVVCGRRALVEARQLSTCGTHGLSCPVACGIPDQGLNPRPLHCKVDS